VASGTEASLPQRGGLLATLPPAYFGLVMATGIVAEASHMAGLHRIAMGLAAIAVFAFVALGALNGVRIARHGALMRAELADHMRAPGYFTWVAATAVLGTLFVTLASEPPIAWVAWAISLAAWFVFTYAIFVGLTVKAAKPPLERGINGGWLLAVVATQSIAVLSELLAMTVPASARLPLDFLALSMWLAGGMLYGWIMALILYRYLFLRLAAADFTAPYWINMGAMAISTLAGALLLAGAGPAAPLLESLRPFLAGVTILYWATATWWIPMLLALVYWRYGHNHHPMRYDPAAWSAVFPLGMYSAATREMSVALQLGFLQPVADFFLLVAALAWIAAFLGMVRAEWRRAP
jgi:tellurite resistance protein TehA-like permease